MKNPLVWSACVFVLAAVALHAADAPPPDPAARLAAARKLADSLKYQHGEIILNKGLAKIVVPPEFSYLDAAGAQTVLEKLWGNPHSDGTLGLITPAKFDPLAEDVWVVVISYEEDGHVKDDDAAKINYDDLLKQMKEGVSEASKERTKQGYPSIELVGWAAPPHYDAASHKLYWAKEIKFGDSPEHTLNYNIRMLGRQGVLVLNAVASMSGLHQVEAATPAILKMVDFQEGHRYADYKEGSDKVATYGLAALVAGGVAAKAGFFKLLWVGILAAKKFIIMGVIAVYAFIKRIITGQKAEKKNDTSAPPASPAP